MSSKKEAEAFKKIELAQIYYEDGAPKTALGLLKEAQEVLGSNTVKPFVTLCNKEIKRREKILRAHRSKGRV